MSYNVYQKKLFVFHAAEGVPLWSSVKSVDESRPSMSFAESR